MLGEAADVGCWRVRLRSEPLDGGADPLAVFRAVAGSSGLVCLTGRWAGGGTIIACDPLVVAAPGADPFEVLGVQPVVEMSTGTGAAPPDPIGGGWFGWLGYDGRSRLAFYDHLLRWHGGRWYFEALVTASRAAALRRARAACAGLLTRLTATDPAAGSAGLAVDPADSSADAATAWATGEFTGADPHAHLAAVERGIELIRAGEIYQVNICTRLSADFSGSTAGFFADLTAGLVPAYGAYVAGATGTAGAGGDTGTVVSLSPEEFLTRRGRVVRTSPIKGTRPRAAGDGVGPGTAAHRHASSGLDELRASTKDAAENVMIVDLMRNDLGRVCQAGSVRVSRFLDIEAHPGVWHLVSTVSGRLRPGVDDGALLRATFPPGSVTGAPKSRALTAIAEIEAVGRGRYTGVIGFASPGWGAQFSVAIRTFEVDDATVALGVGGGITVDSVPALEWQECLDKARPLLTAVAAAQPETLGADEVISRGRFGAGDQRGDDPRADDPHADDQRADDQRADDQRSGGLLETILVLDGVPVRLADHLARLDRSARELYGVGVRPQLAARITADSSASTGRTALRVTLTPDGQVHLVSAHPSRRPGPVAARTVARSSGSWRHKWADRRALGVTEAELGAGTVPLFVAADATVLETSRGNVFLLLADGGLVTPPLREDLLPGITRRALLDLARDQDRPTQLRCFDVDEMCAHAAFWTSSLSLAVPITHIDGIALPRRDGEIAALAQLLEPGSVHRLKNEYRPRS